MICDCGFLARKYFQRGAAALPISALLLFVAALVLIAVSRTTLMEQRISANEIRAKQAFQAAQAGVDRALAYMQTKGGIDKYINEDGSLGKDGIVDDVDYVALIAPLDGSEQYCFSYCDPGTSPPVNACEPCQETTPGPPTCGAALTDPDKFARPMVLSCGFSDDKIAKRPIVVTFTLASFLDEAPDNPLMSKGTLDVSGSATVVNYFTNLTIWTGAGFTSIGNSGKTFIRNPTVLPPKLSDPLPDVHLLPSSCTTNATYTCLTDKFTKGPDIIDNDLSLKNLTADEMFKNFFGVDFVTYKSEIATRTITSAQVSDSVVGIVGKSDESIVITGDTDLPPNVTIGSRDHPMVIIIDGNWGGGNVTMHGILYVRGNANVAGNPKIIGALSVAGTMSGTGSLDVIFDPFALENASGLSKAGVISGTWRDWL